MEIRHITINVSQLKVREHPSLKSVQALATGEDTEIRSQSDPDEDDDDDSNPSTDWDNDWGVEDRSALDSEDDDNSEDDEDEDRATQLVTGYASVYNSDSEDLGGFIERVAPTAFTRSLSSARNGQSNIFAFWGHDPNQPIGSTNSKKLELKSDDKGLAFRLATTRLTPAQLSAVQDGDMRMSFGFIVRGDSWTQDNTGQYIRTLTDVDLFEVSPVSMPAYPNTSAGITSERSHVAVNAFEAFKASQTTDPTKYSRKVELKSRAAELLGRLIRHSFPN